MIPLPSLASSPLQLSNSSSSRGQAEVNGGGTDGLAGYVGNVLNTWNIGSGATQKTDFGAVGGGIAWPWLLGLAAGGFILWRIWKK